MNPGNPNLAPKSIKTSWNGLTSLFVFKTGCLIASAAPSAELIGLSNSEMQSHLSRYVVSGNTKSAYGTVSE